MRHRRQSLLSGFGEQAQTTEHEKVEKLLDIMQRKDDRLFHVFCDALRKTGQAGAAQMITQNALQQQQQRQQQQQQEQQQQQLPGKRPTKLGENVLPIKHLPVHF